MVIIWLIVILLDLVTARDFVHPIKVKGRDFIDSVTGKTFNIKGVDYQPGGSSGYYGRSDPLSEPDICARDVFLFKRLGVNAIRVYTVNPDLNHDECMTMLASAGIYLILDVNSPRVGESLNRYEPWTTYTKEYLEHVFKVVEGFSGYNNTLGFFAGNEVINDDKSATNSPGYIKAVVRDIKLYIHHNAPREIPVGYSAADDLRYRISLAKYLECGDEFSSLDFYGVNSYQWCGAQTFQSSGYNTLLADYDDYALPLFLSEYGCNLVVPRLFQEVRSLYTDMTSVFNGGLIYEFSQEPNNYGLVELDHKGSVYLLQDFDTLAHQFKSLRVVNYAKKQVERPGQCLAEYTGLNTHKELPESFGTKMIVNGVDVKRGQYVMLSTNTTTHQIFDSSDSEIKEKSLEIPLDWYKRLPDASSTQLRGKGRREFQNMVDSDSDTAVPTIRKLSESEPKLQGHSSKAATFMLSVMAVSVATFTLWAALG